MSIKTMLLAASSLLVVTPAFASSGMTFTSEPGTHYKGGDALLALPDGGFLVGGYFWSEVYPEYAGPAIAAYNASGQLVTSFGSNGISRLPCAACIGLDEVINDMALTPDGKVVAVGSAMDEWGTISYGTLYLFDMVTGEIITDALFSYGAYTFFNEVIVDALGRVHMIGTAVNAVGYSWLGDMLAVRLLSDLSLDPSFSGDGAVLLDFKCNGKPDPTDDFASSALLSSSGRLVLGGGVGCGSGFDFALAALTSSGALDTSFGVSGKASVDHDAMRDNLVVQLLKQGSAFVAVGNSRNLLTNENRLALARFSSSGVLDTGFGFSSGKPILDIDPGSTNERFSGAALDAEKRIVVAGSTYSAPSAIWGGLVFRVEEHGRWKDASYAYGFNAFFPFYGPDAKMLLKDVFVQSDGKIVAAGSYQQSYVNLGFTILRTTSTGTLDSSFGQ